MPTVEFRMDTTGIPRTYIVINNGAGIQLSGPIHACQQQLNA